MRAGSAMGDQSSDVFGKRYGEVLLVRMSSTGPIATVYNTFPLNDCPAELWDALDADAITRERGALGAVLNGPRYWLMSRIAKKPGEPQPAASFGGLEMLEQATVAVPSIPAPYTANLVDRRAVFTFDAGRPVFELVDPDGGRWVMQSYSQVLDQKLSLDDLPLLGSRLQPPAGWRYETRTLTKPLVVDTTSTVAHVLQDELTNTYSLQA
jgi:hypothetical protein